MAILCRCRRRETTFREETTVFENAELGQRYTHTYLTEKSARDTAQEFRTWVKNHIGTDLPEDFDTSGDPEALLARLTLHLNKKRFALPVSQEEAKATFERFYIPPTEYHFEFADKFDWNPGEFGDTRTMLFSGGNATRAILERNGVWVVKFFDEDDHGISRMFLMQIGDGVMAFNGQGRLFRRLMANILGDWKNLPVHGPLEPYFDVSSYHLTTVHITGGQVNFIGPKPAKEFITIRMTI
jgi:hypothetical protein